jgi:hypothetical protein
MKGKLRAVGLNELLDGVFDFIAHLPIINFMSRNTIRVTHLGHTISITAGVTDNNVPQLGH